MPQLLFEGLSLNTFTRSPSSSRLRLHHLYLIPVPAEIAVGIEVRVVAHDVLIGAIEPGMVVLVAEFERSAGRRIAEGRHTADELVLAKGGLVGAGHRICRDSVD